MSDSAICLRTDKGLKPLINQRDVVMLRCEDMAACDGSEEVKIPPEIKDEFVIKSIQECNKINAERAKAEKAKAEEAKGKKAKDEYTVPRLPFQFYVDFNNPMKKRPPLKRSP